MEHELFLCADEKTYKWNGEKNFKNEDVVTMLFKYNNYENEEDQKSKKKISFALVFVTYVLY